MLGGAIIVSEGLIALEEADPGIPEFGLQWLGSLALVLQSVIVPGGQVPLARAPPELLAAPGPVAWLPGNAVGAGVGEVMPVVVEGLLIPALGAALGLEALPDVPPVEVCAIAAAEEPTSDAATRSESRKVVMAGSHRRMMGSNGQPEVSFPISGLPEIGTKMISGLPEIRSKRGTIRLQTPA